jgi:hypothetical protein
MRNLILLTLSLSTFFGTLNDSFAVTPKAKPRTARVSKRPAKGTAVGTAIGTAVKRTKSLRFDGRTVEAVSPGKFDSFTHLSEGDGSGGRKRLYDLPRDFAKKASLANTEWGVR